MKSIMLAANPTAVTGSIVFGFNAQALMDWWKRTGSWRAFCRRSSFTQPHRCLRCIERDAYFYPMVASHAKPSYETSQ
jgi:hypothetical protein